MKGDGIRGVLAGASGLLFGVTGIIRWISGDAGGMAEAMLHFAPEKSTGLPAAAYPGMAKMITGYLTGAEERFSYTLMRADGTMVSCFHDYEAAHMADCRGLISLDTWVCLICLGLLLAAVGWQILRGRKRGSEAWLPFLRGMRNALLALCGLAGALALWAAIDFDSLFVLFHRIAFTNDLWLLDPRTDLLIRLMPVELFMHLGLKGLGAAAGWTAALFLTAAVGIGRIRKGQLVKDGKTEAA